jgi:hypothetical protein
VILVLDFYPQFGLRRSESSLKAAIDPAQQQQQSPLTASAAP